ncbi:MAG: cell division protein FtsI/penicillin-binding protein 2 [Akkermansiaceae bacterium]|jgi:cell division protein FtsI/penicillin-binding protein 2
MTKSEALDLPLSLWQKLHHSAGKTPPLFFTPSPAAPFACGFITPRLLLPDDSPTWPHRQIKSTLLHEAAHLRRRDPLIRFLSALIRAAFWFHPLVWIAQRQLIAAQEQSCDQAALSHGLSPDDYAGDILDRNDIPLATDGPSGKRTYPLGESLGHIAGYVRQTDSNKPDQKQGTIGLEKSQDFKFSQKHDLKSTIDSEIQSLCYDLLSKQEFPGAIIVQDPNTGEILAMASYPSSDPNLFIPNITKEDFNLIDQNEQNPMRNRATAVHIPGSIITPLIGQGKITADSLTTFARAFTSPSTVNAEPQNTPRSPVSSSLGKSETARVAFTAPTHNSWFSGYGPYKQPKYTITVMLNGANGGGKYAAPLAAEVFKNLLKSVE